MAFERRKVTTQNNKNNFWPFLQGYWILVPALYFIFVMPTIFQVAPNESLPLSTITNLFYNAFNLGLGAILYVIHPKERAKVGAADGILKIAVVQQLLARNVFGLLLTVATWYKLPEVISPEAISSSENKGKYLAPKILYSLTILITVLTLLSIIGIYMLN